MVLFRKHWQDWCKHFSASGIAMEQEQWLSVADFFIINLFSFIMKAAHPSNNKFRLIELSSSLLAMIIAHGYE